MKYDYDIVVIGAGSAGITAAKTARGFGKKVALIEQGKIGGECTWTGCVPSKALIKAANIAHDLKSADRWGIGHQGAIDTSNVMAYVHERIQAIYQTEKPDLFEKQGIKVIAQTCRFIDAHSLEFADKTVVTAKKIIICTGSKPFVPPIEGIDTVNYKTNETFFDQTKLPRSLIILGGGPIGAEMASACNRLGVNVTMIEMQERILPREDHELVTLLTDYMQKEGVTIRTGLKAVKVMQQQDDVVLTCVDQQGKEQICSAEQLLVAVGQRAETDQLGLEHAGVKTNKKGIETDATLRTTARNIYAAGDVVGPYYFSHMAWYQAVIAVRNACVPLFKKKIDYTNVIWVTFTAPELASAGMTEREAIEQYGKKNVKLYKMPYRQLDRAITDNEEAGMIKCICDTKGRLLGIHILGARAGDIIHEAQLAKWYKMKLQEIQPVIHAYPTYAELTWHVAKKAYIDHLLRSPLIRIARWFTK